MRRHPLSHKTNANGSLPHGGTKNGASAAGSCAEKDIGPTVARAELLWFAQNVQMVYWNHRYNAFEVTGGLPVGSTVCKVVRVSEKLNSTAAVFPASDDSSFIAGVEVFVDSGTAQV
jgi:hypothetical protein